MQIQNINSYKCGLYCILYIYFKSRNQTMQNIVKFFNKQNRLNDKILIKIFKKLYK